MPISWPTSNPRALASIPFSFSKSRVPKPVTYGAQNQATLKTKLEETNWIPSLSGLKSFSIASRIKARCDIVKSSLCEGVAVQPGVEPAKRVLVVREKIIVQQRDNASHDLYVGCQLKQRGAREMREDTHRCRTTCTIIGKDIIIDNDPVVKCLAVTSGFPRPAGLYKLQIKNSSA